MSKELVVSSLVSFIGSFVFRTTDGYSYTLVLIKFLLFGNFHSSGSRCLLETFKQRYIKVGTFLPLWF
jgi:hypothetical protein